MATKKLVKGTALGVAALSTFAVASGVQAEETTAVETTTASTSTQTATVSTTNIQTVQGVTVADGTAIVTETPSEETVNQAAEIKTAADQAVTDQTGVVASATQAESAAQETVNQAQTVVNEAQETKDQATDENIVAAQAAVDGTSSEIASQEAAASAASQATSAAQAESATAQGVVDKDNAAIASQQEKVNQAQATVDNAQASLDGTGSAQVIAERDAAQTALTAAQSAENQAQTALKEAQESDAANQAALEAAQKDVDAKQEVANQTASDLTAAEIAAQTASTELTNANTAVANAQANLDSNSSQAIAERDAAQATLDQAKTAESNAQATLTSLTQADTNKVVAAQADLDAKTKVLEDLTAQVNAKYTEYSAAYSELATAKKTVTELQADLTRLSSADEKPAFEFSQSLLDSLAKFGDAYRNFKQVLADNNIDQADTIAISNNAAVSQAVQSLSQANAAIDKSEIYKVFDARLDNLTTAYDNALVTTDANGNLALTQEAYVAWSLYATDLINYVRQAMGFEATATATIRSAETIKRASEAYQNAYLTNTSVYTNHGAVNAYNHTYGYNGQQYTLYTDSEALSWTGTNAAGGFYEPNYQSTDTISTDYFKNKIEKSLQTLMFYDNDSNWQHLDTLLSYAQYGMAITAQDTAVVIAVDEKRTSATNPIDQPLTASHILTTKEEYVTKVQTELASAQEQQAEAQDKLNTVKASYNSLVTAKDEASSAKDKAAAYLAEVQKNGDSTNAGLDKASADQAVANLEAQIASLQTLSVPQLSQDVITAYKAYLSSTSSDWQATKDDLFDSIEDWYTTYAYALLDTAVTPLDDTSVDLANLTESQVTALSQYYNYINNQLRKQIFGDDALKVVTTTDAVQAALQIAQNYRNLDDSTGKHSSKALNDDKNDNVKWSTESINYINSETNTSMSDLYKTILRIAVKTWYDDYNFDYDHVIQEIGGGNSTKRISGTFVTSQNLTSKLTEAHEIHFTDTTDTSNEIASPYDLDSLNTQLAVAKIVQARAALAQATATRQVAETRLANAQKAVDSLTADVATKQAALDEAKIAQALAKAANTVAQDNLAKAQAANDQAQAQLTAAKAKLTQSGAQTPAAQAALEQATATRQAAEARLANAQQAVDNLTADVATKQAALEQAQAQLRAEQDTLADLQAQKATDEATLKAAQTKVDALKAEEAKIAASLTSLKAQLEAQKATLSKLQNADQVLADAKATLAASLKAHDDAKAVLDAEVAKLNTLLKDQKDAKAQYEVVKGAYEQAQLAEQKKAILAAGGTSVAITDEAGNIVGYIDGNQTVGTNLKPVTYSRVARAQSLPETGSQESLLALFGYAVLAMVGLGYKGKRRRG